MEQIKRATQHQKQIQKKLLYEYSQSKEALLKRSKYRKVSTSSAQGKYNFLSSLTNTMIDHLDDTTVKYTIMESLICIIKRSKETGEIIRSNIFIADNFMFSQKRLYLFAKNTLCGDSLVNSFTSNMNSKEKQSNLFNNIISDLLKKKLFESFNDEGKSKEADILQVLKQTFNEIVSILEFLKDKIISRKIDFASLDQDGTIYFTSNLERIRYAKLQISLKLQKENKWEMVLGLENEETDQFLFGKECERLQKILIVESQKIMNSLGVILVDRIRKVIHKANSLRVPQPGKSKKKIKGSKNRKKKKPSESVRT